MFPNISKKIELLTNILIIVVSILFAFFLIQKLLYPNQNQPRQIKEIVKGASVNIPEIDWQTNKKTVLIFLQTNCKFCKESTTFYQNLVKQASEKNINIVAVFPGAMDESIKYLKENNIDIQTVRQSSPNTIKVPGTPTLLIVDDKGEVLNSWIGKLTPDKEQEVVNQL